MAGKYPTKGMFSTQEQLTAYCKPLSTGTLQEWMEQEGIAYNAYPTSEAIDRMRMLMAIRKHMFTIDVKAAPQYRDVPLDKLLQIATDKGLSVPQVGNPSLLKVRAIRALKQAN